MLGSGQSYLMAFNITAATTANTPIHIDATVAIKSLSTYPSAVIRLVAGRNLSGASVILEALRGSLEYRMLGPFAGRRSLHLCGC
jgi:hypothetical protein